MKRFSRIAAWTAAALLAATVFGIIGARLWLNAFLQSPKFRDSLNAAATRSLHAAGEFRPLNFAGTTAHSDGFSARGNEDAAFTRLRADEVRAEFDWRGVLQRKWVVKELSVQRLELAFQQPRAIPARPAIEPRIDTTPRGKSWRLDLQKISIGDARLSWGDAGTPAGQFSDSRLTILPSGEAWLIEAASGRLAQSGWPELALDSAKLRWQQPTLFVTGANLRQGEGRLDVTGEIKFGDRADLQVEIAQIDVTPLLPVDWRARLFGKLSGTARVNAALGENAAGGVSAEGSLHLAEGRLEALPLLDQVAAFTRTQRFRQIPLTQASVDFTRSDSRVTARNFVMESSGLMRAEGAFVIENGRIDGTFQVGITPASLQWLPGAQGRVFTVARDGYLWTSVRLTGPVEHPAEDLTPRLIAAAGDALLDDAQGAAKDAEGAVRDAAKSVLDLLLR